MNEFLKKIEKLIELYLRPILINILRSVKHVDWMWRLIMILLIFLYIVGVLIFSEKGPYMTSSQKNKLINNDVMIEREDNQK